jgi:hypothetical protein
MAGGAITRITGGNFSTELSGGMEIHTDTFDMIAGKQNRLGGKDGTVMDIPKDPPPAGKYFVKGWWTDNKDKPIKESHIGDTIRFHVETKDIPDGDEISFTVYDWDGMINPDDILNLVESGTGTPYNKIKIKGNKGYIEWTTGAGSQKMIEEEGDDEIELYVECVYKEEKVELPEMEADYLKLYHTLFPLKVHQRSFAPWEKFGNFFLDSFKNSFHGDDRGFTLKDNFVENEGDTVEIRNKKLKDSGFVTSRLYQMIEFDYFYDGLTSSKSFCNMTQGYRMFVSPWEEHKIQTPEHYEYYGEHSLINSSTEKGVINISIWGSDPLVKPAPDIRWKLTTRLKINEDKKTLSIDGTVVGKGFPAYEAFVEDSKGKKIFLHAFMPKSELLVTTELDFFDWPDYFKIVNMEIEIVMDTGGYHFGEKIIMGIFNSNYDTIEYSEISITEWNNLYLSIPISKDVK